MVAGDCARKGLEEVKDEDYTSSRVRSPGQPGQSECMTYQPGKIL